MRSAPASSKQAVSNGGGGGSSASLNGYTIGGGGGVGAGFGDTDISETSTAESETRRYTHEMMLQLFKPQELTEGFVSSDHVYSSEALDPVSISELTPKEQELLASGSINSGASKRYNGSQQQPQQQSGNRQQSSSSSHYYSRNGQGMQRSGSHSMLPGSRSKYKDDGARNSHAAERAVYDGLDSSTSTADGLFGSSGGDDGSLWARQSIVRETVGSFGADGVFRMGGRGGADDGELLEGPPSRSSTRGDLIRDVGDYSSSRTASPAVGVGMRAGGAGPGILQKTHSQGRAAGVRSPQQPGGHGASLMGSGGGWSSAWDGLGSRTPHSAMGQQSPQNRLVERAEQMKWCYRDPQGNIQGPFSTTNMQEWYSADYFPPDLQVCHEGSSSFEPLGSLVARVGDPQSVFIYAALAALTQGFQQPNVHSTPVTPAPMSRVASGIHLSAYAGGGATADGAGSLALLGSGAAHDGAIPKAVQDGTASSISGAVVGGGSGGPSISAEGSLATLASPAAYAPNAVSSSNTMADAAQPADGSATPSAAAPVTAATSQAAQLSLLLNEQLVLVSAIGDSQRNILKIQEQLQQSLNKLMQDVAQETSAIHFKAQIDRVPVQHEIIFALQQRAQMAEERLHHEYAQYTQIQAAQIAQLETKIDPVIKDIVLRNGTAFALTFISQQLQDLNKQAVGESDSLNTSAAAQEQVPAESLPSTDLAADSAGASASASDAVKSGDAAGAPNVSSASVTAATPAATTAAKPAAAADGNNDETAANAKNAEASKSTKQEVDQITNMVKDVDIAATKPAASSKASKQAAKQAALEKTTKSSAAQNTKPTETKSKPSSQAASPAPSAPQTTAASSAESATKSASAAKVADAISPKAAPAAIATPAPWSTNASLKAKQPKKSLLQIQQEEEEATKRRQQLEGQQRSLSVNTRSFAGSYADRLGASSSATVAPRSLASIMEEQSKESSASKANTASTFTASVAANSSANSSGSLRTLTLAAAAAAPPPPASAPVLSTTSAWGARTGGSAAAAFASSVAGSGSAASKQPAGKLAAKESGSANITSTANIATMPSMDFLEWCYSRLGSLRGIDITKFIEVLLTFPTQASDTTLEIITEQVYAYSSTLNGRAFAEDFMKRRRKDLNVVRNGNLKSAPVNWAQILGSSVSRSAGSNAGNGMGSVGARIASASSAGSMASRGSASDSSFQVVNKKGRK
ncbi:kinesin-like protein [Coemansia sp. Benny D115]|nr:kinesin-like protein [Coemansia sp. Benny D115]